MKEVRLMNNCYILLGTNLGDKQSNLNTAKILLKERLGQVLKCSSIYETEPWGKSEQDSFLNQVLIISIIHGPIETLNKCLEVEGHMGRVRVEKWMERIIDIDILYFNDEIHTSSSLIIPHPEIQNRRFTLEPLVEISPDYVHPKLMKTNKQLLDICNDSLEVKLFSHRT
ncbi:MAG: 2-amino-4-hydroxy-6-hydroxymethyldihydropteridine diphosphokinase [Cyclobacteriaceae bacterium]|jgi:2-amino-4-hydroxy-6-hydroxymethyldihydropteridine diphosphokinase